MRKMQVFIPGDRDDHGIDPAPVNVIDRLKKEPASA
jgi:hypothetical protein